ncbi:MAG TPA: CRISPR-associated endonuclease Cas1 [Pyrinomonadaceae bacterium]|nr:CRISPR-associated endonuclease Cas1 [Pyrinomonadaceae bacterium]
MSTLYITTQGATVQKRSGQFVVFKKSDILQNVPETHVRQIILVGNINLTTPVVSFCLEKQIEVVFLSQGGKFRGRLNGDASRSVEVRRRQYERALDKTFCLRQARLFIGGKIGNQIMIAQQQAKNSTLPTDFEVLKSLLRKAENAESIESLLGIEGASSAVYFRLFAKWIPQPFIFDKRTSNPPHNEINALLSLSYTLIYNRIGTHLNMIGLDAYQGFFHQARNGHAALASDLMEEFRPVVADALVLKLVRRRQLKLSDFERDKGSINLTDTGKKIFFAEFENKLGSKRQTSAGEQWSLSYAKIIERQARHFARVIMGEEPQYQPFVIK